jgi:hypothetical protein
VVVGDQDANLSHGLSTGCIGLAPRTPPRRIPPLLASYDTSAWATRVAS